MMGTTLVRDYDKKKFSSTNGTQIVKRRWLNVLCSYFGHIDEITSWPMGKLNGIYTSLQRCNNVKLGSCDESKGIL